jgi:antitoxin (DNA-binding transcriptional repressor) of toxin-antitoxin stability system
MALPNGAGGYQFGDGNVTEVNITTQGTPVAKTAAASLTAAEITSGIITYTGAVANLTFPTVADTEVLVSSAKNDSCFDLAIINTGGTNTVSVVGGTGWSTVGSLAIAAGVSGRFLARKVGDLAWTLYRVS